MEPITSSNGNNQLLYFTSLSFTSDGQGIIFISDRTGHPNLFLLDLITGKERQLTFNREGFLKSYPYFKGRDKRGFGKASVSFHPFSGKIYYLQGRQICCVDLEGKQRILGEYPDDQITGYTDISRDGMRLCLATVDEKAFGNENASKLIQNYYIDKRCREQNLNSYLRIYETDSGKEVTSEPIPKAWVTHIQFCPLNKNIILYNHERCRQSGLERMWLWNGLEHRRLRQLGGGRSPDDWTSHEVWEPTGRSIIYHGGYKRGSMFIGKVDADGSNLVEISLPKQYTKYGHFIPGNSSLLVTDGYYQEISDIERINSFMSRRIKSIIPRIFKTSVKKILKIKSMGEWISILKVDWKKQEIKWFPLCRHGSSWSSQDAHPHPIFNNVFNNNEVFFTSERNGKRSIYKIKI